MEDVILFGVMCQVQSHSPCFRRNLQDIHMSQAASVVHLVGEGDIRCGNQFSILRTLKLQIVKAYLCNRAPAADVAKNATKLLGWAMLMHLVVTYYLWINC